MRAVLRQPVATDALIAAAALALAVVTFSSSAVAEPGDHVRAPDLLGVVLCIAMTAPIAVRRPMPRRAMAIAGFAAHAVTALGYGFTIGALAVWALTGSLAFVTDRRTSIAIGVIGAASVSWSVWAFGNDNHQAVLMGVAVMVGALPPLVGDAMRRQRELLDEVRALRDADVARAIDAERLRIARDVHDTVGHHLSAISLQARAGGLAEPDAALGTIARLSDRALADTHGILGLLRADVALRPVGGLRDLSELLATAALAGLEVDVRIDADTAVLPDLVDTCAFRVVQEALTNAARHAAPTHARLDIRRADQRLLVTVSDDGPPAPRAVGGSVGRGLVGMRERVHAAGGTLDAAPRSPRGWRVHAELPCPTS